MTSPVWMQRTITNANYAIFKEGTGKWTNGSYDQNAAYNLTPTVNSPPEAAASSQNGLDWHGA
jgi:hypothetical protein